MTKTVFGLLSCLIAVQVRFVIGESFYHVGPEEAEEQLQEGIHSYACMMYSCSQHCSLPVGVVYCLTLSQPHCMTQCMTPRA